MEHNNKRPSTSRKNVRNNSSKNWNNAKKPIEKRKKTVDKKYVLTELDKADNEAIKLLKLNKPECPLCHEPILDVAACLADSKTGEPVHFDCVLKKLTEQEKLLPNQKIVYIGKGVFAVVVFENPQDLTRFKIIRQIEWETKDTKAEWRNEISNLYSQVH